MIGTIEQQLVKGRRSFLTRGAGGIGLAAVSTLLCGQSLATPPAVPHARC